MLAMEKPDAVSVVVPTIYHKHVAIDCLNHKIPTLVEKPISNNAADGRKIIKAAAENKTPLMVGHIERFNPAVLKLKQLIDRGKLGSILNLLAIRVGISPPKGKQLNVALELGIHDVDIFNFLTGETPVEKRIDKLNISNTNISDSSSITLRYKSSVGIIQTNWITPIKIRRLYVTGIKGFIDLDYINQKLIFYDRVAGWESNERIEDFSGLVSLSTVPTQVFISKGEPLKLELSFFLDNLSKSPILYKMTEDAINALEVLAD